MQRTYEVCDRVGNVYYLNTFFGVIRVLYKLKFNVFYIKKNFIKF